MERENNKLEICRLSKRKSSIFQQDCNGRRNKMKVMACWNFGDYHLRHCLFMSSVLNQVLKDRQNEWKWSLKCERIIWNPSMGWYHKCYCWNS